MLIRSNKFKVVSEDIIGIDSIWEMLISVKDDDVRKNIANMLANLCIRLKSLNDDFSVKYWKKYNERLIKYLEMCVEKCNDNGIQGIVFLMKSIIKLLDGGGDIISYNDLVIFQNSCIDYVFVNTEKNEKKNLKIGLNETVLQVKDKLSIIYEIPSDKVYMKYNKKWLDYNDEHKNFKDVVGSNNNFIEVYEKEHPVLKMKVNPKTLLMENRQLFNILYELLHNSQLNYIDETWELINILPKNPLLEEEVKKLGTQVNEKIDWNKYIDSKSIYKLSYCLQIIKSFLIQSDNGPFQIEGNEKINKSWLDTFRNNKGIKHLITVIYQYEVSEFTTNLGFSCLNEILILLKNVAKVGEEVKVESDEIIRKLTDIIFFICISSELKQKSSKILDMQIEYKRKRDKVQLIKSYNQNQVNNNTFNEEQAGELDEYHPIIRENWLKEENSIILITNFLSSFFENQKIVNIFLKSDNFDKIICEGFIKLKNYKIKQIIIEFLKKLYENLDPNNLIKNLFLTKIFKIIFDMNTLKSAISNAETSEDFFKFFSEYLKIVDFNTIKKIEFEKKILEITDFIINYINNYSVETEKYDTALTGFLCILRIFILNDNHLLDYISKNNNLYDILIDKCIFSKCKINNENPSLSLPKCRSSTSRKSAFSLLSAICYNNTIYLEKLINFLIEYHELGYWRSKRYMSWNIICSSEEKSISNFVGLQNLGCICYMNSLLQQFFMIPTLREALISSQINTTRNKEELILFQIQKIFANLKTSDRQYHNPKDFCNNFKISDGQPFNVLEQMDVDEFFNLLIDRVELNLKGTKYENIFKYHFGGMLTNELICKGCPHYSEREESFNSISLQVKNKKSIFQSFESFVEGEMLEGENAYLCEKCDKKVNTLRRQCLKKLPRIMIVVLKRFDFDYDTMTKFKVNDFCEFPLELNVEKFTQEYLQKNEKIKNEGKDVEKEKTTEDIIENESSSQSQIEFTPKPDNYYKYKLTGTLIHMGTAESGHYYSIIKDNSDQLQNNNQWFEFNDHIVRPYDLDDLPNDAFGGFESWSNNKIGNTNSKSNSIEKTTNAYLLFYQREYDDKEDDETIMDNLKNPNKYSNITNEIVSIIKNDNLQYWISRNIFSSEYNEFAQDLILNYDTSNQFLKTIWKKNDNLTDKKRIIKNSNLSDGLFVNLKLDVESDDMEKIQILVFRYLALFFFGTLVRNKDRAMIPNFIDIIKGSINKNVNNAIWILEEFTNDSVFDEFVLDCPIIDMRKFVIGIIYCSLLKIHNTDKIDSSNQFYKNKILNFINYVLTIIGKKTTERYAQKDFTHCFLILWRISSLGSYYRQYLLKLNLLTYIILYIFKKNNANKYEILLPQNTNQSFNIYIQNYESTFSKLVVSCPTHFFLSTIKMAKIEKLTAIEDIIEKKKLDNNPSSNIIYLMLLFSDLCRSSKFNDKLDSFTITNVPFLNVLPNQLYSPTTEEKSFIRFNNNQILKFYLGEVKTKQSAISMGKTFNYVCFNNTDNNLPIQELLINSIHEMEHNEVENVLMIFKIYLLIDDNLKDQRIKSSLNKYFNILTENSKYYKFTDINIDFVINIFTVKFDIFNKFIDNFKDQLNKLIKWLKENPYPPQFVPSKTTVLYKKKPHNYQSTQINTQIHNYHTKCTKISQEKILKLSDILKKNILKPTSNLYDSDMDLVDYKFSHNEIIKYDNNIKKIVSVLDEMICFEYGVEGSDKKIKQWTDTDYKGLVLCDNAEFIDDEKGSKPDKDK